VIPAGEDGAGSRSHTRFITDEIGKSLCCRGEGERICGLIIDRREVGEVGAFSGYTDEQLLQEAMERARRLGLAGPAEVIKLTPKSGSGSG
jgi:hypothetical protein